MQGRRRKFGKANKRPSRAYFWGLWDSFSRLLGSSFASLVSLGLHLGPSGTHVGGFFGLNVWSLGSLGPTWMPEGFRGWLWGACCANFDLIFGTFFITSWVTCLLQILQPFLLHFWDIASPSFNQLLIPFFNRFSHLFKTSDICWIELSLQREPRSEGPESKGESNFSITILVLFYITLLKNWRPKIHTCCSFFSITFCVYVDDFWMIF